MRRLFWRIAYPVTIAAHKLFGLSYRWVNVGKAAWLTPETGFGALWHYRWFGNEIRELPSHVILSGLRHTVSVHEGLVVFVSDMSSGRIEFTRDPHDQYAFLWYIATNGSVPACHVEDAIQWVDAVYGGSHEIKRLPV